MSNPEEQSDSFNAEGIWTPRRGTTLEEANYAEECSILRADVILLFAKHGIADNSAGGWAVFEIENEETAGDIEGKEVRSPRTTEVLVIVQRNLEPPNTCPILRFMTNEKFDLIEGHGFRTYDCTVDDENDSQYLVDAAFLNDESELTEPTTAPLFWVDEDGILQIRRFEKFTVIADLNMHDDDSEEGEQIFPFGSYKKYKDRIHALGVARSIFSRIKESQPVAKMPNP
jgi:hypothetical protein